jgi:hypothetical protein
MNKFEKNHEPQKWETKAKHGGQKKGRGETVLKKI